LLDSTRIVCATLTGLEPGLLGSRTFDWCIMDEASQTTEAAAWTPLPYASRLVLAGDPLQLPPTVVSPEAVREGFAISLMERLMKENGPGCSRRLTVQYRSHHDIMQFSSQEFYDGALEADASISTHLLQDLPAVASTELTGTPLLFIDTAGANFEESVEADGDSRFNLEEARVMEEQVHALLASGLSPTGIAVISPYSAQVRLLRDHLDLPGLEIDSVDGFQGREKEAVLVSLVRSNRDGEIGFLGDVRRMNVALTRARRKLIVIGDSATIGSHPFYQRLVNYFESAGAYRSIWEWHAD
jgi:ATP-dependent RNA/DNA helicase IGHMBP2